jgi:hypothetical protein
MLTAGSTSAFSTREETSEPDRRTGQGRCFAAEAFSSAAGEREFRCRSEVCPPGHASLRQSHTRFRDRSLLCPLDVDSTRHIGANRIAGGPRSGLPIQLVVRPSAPLSAPDRTARARRRLAHPGRLRSCFVLIGALLAADAERRFYLVGGP